MIQRLLFFFLLFAACSLHAGDIDSITILGQLSGNCTIPILTLRGFNVMEPVVYSAKVNSYQSFQIKIPYTGIRQFTLSGGRLRYDFLVTPAQTNYRFTIGCRDDGNYNVNLEDSKENEAFGLLGRIEKNLVADVPYTINNNADIAARQKAIADLFAAHAHNLQQLQQAYPNTFTSSVLAPASAIPPSSSPDSVIAAVKNAAWNNPALYQTDLPVAFFNIVKAITADFSAEQKQALIGKLLDATPQNLTAAKFYQQSLFEFLFYTLQENQLYAFADWADKHAGKIANPSLQAKLQGLKKTLPGNKYIDISARDTAGVERSLSEAVNKNNYTVILFWSPDCEHCREEMPALISFYNTYHAKGVEIFAVTLDSEPGKWKNFIHQNKLGWINVAESGAQGNMIANNYMINYTPTLILIDKQGNIRSRFGDLEVIEQLVNKN